MGPRAQARKEARERDLGSQRRAVESRGRNPAREEGAEEEEASTARLGEVLAKTIRHFFPEWDEWLKEIRDPRDPIRTIYPASFIVTTGILMFLTKLGARRQMKYAFETPTMLKNVNRLAGTRTR